MICVDDQQIIALQILTLNACRGVVVALWVFPFLGISAPFFLIPGQVNTQAQHNNLF